MKRPIETESVEEPVPEGEIKYINDNDVLCGRGSGPNDHCGNISFRELVSTRRKEYLATSSRSQKARIAREIVEVVWHLKPPGRFLEKVTETSWNLVSEEKTLEKVKQALRQMRHRRSESMDHSVSSKESFGDNDSESSHRRNKGDQAEFEVDRSKRVHVSNSLSTNFSDSLTLNNLVTKQQMYPFQLNPTMNVTPNVPFCPNKSQMQDINPYFPTSCAMQPTTNQHFPIASHQPLKPYETGQNRESALRLPSSDFFSPQGMKNRMYFHPNSVDSLNNSTQKYPMFKPHFNAPNQCLQTQSHSTPFYYNESMKCLPYGNNPASLSQGPINSNNNNLLPQQQSQMEQMQSCQNYGQTETSFYEMPIGIVGNVESTIEPQPLTQQRRDESADDMSQAFMTILDALQDSEQNFNDISIDPLPDNSSSYPQMTYPHVC